MIQPTRIHPFLAGALLLASSHCTVTTDGDATGDAAEPMRGAGEVCGGFAGLLCDDDLACMYAPGTCGKGDQGGVCRPRPEVCTFIYRPVCGCDGRTYPNGCEAARAGASIARVGACDGGGDGEPAGTGSPGR